LRKAKWTARRWKLPSLLRAEIYSEILARETFADVFNVAFLDGLEKRRNLLESRYWKAIGLQAPLFILLILSVLQLDFPITVLGIASVIIASVLLHIWLLADIYKSPSFSPLVGWLTIIFVVSCDLISGTHLFLNRSFQPYQTSDNFNRLWRLRDTNRAEYDRIIKEMIEKHTKRGFWMRLLTRPKLPRIEPK
jgi:hypothetical protein